MAAKAKKAPTTAKRFACRWKAAKTPETRAAVCREVADAKLRTPFLEAAGISSAAFHNWVNRSKRPNERRAPVKKSRRAAVVAALQAARTALFREARAAEDRVYPSLEKVIARVRIDSPNVVLPSYSQVAAIVRHQMLLHGWEKRPVAPKKFRASNDPSFFYKVNNCNPFVR
jgi:hypothetical protein